ncbi:predicted protein [Nematostella vectensis]|uniref:CUB domain-containing protein n=1 Tax=Nematostella vectensis TaxID=45351 RepID=A7RMC8_NEMVE|nr:predicted protein [Nematostella vectensis]|eukprot:XP_001639382.1 predicted protein [Nematostella vectensis]
MTNLFWTPLGFISLLLVCPVYLENGFERDETGTFVGGNTVYSSDGMKVSDQNANSDQNYHQKFNKTEKINSTTKSENASNDISNSSNVDMSSAYTNPNTSLNPNVLDRKRFSKKAKLVMEEEAGLGEQHNTSEANYDEKRNQTTWEMKNENAVPRGNAKGMIRNEISLKNKQKTIKVEPKSGINVLSNSKLREENKPRQNPPEISKNFAGNTLSQELRIYSHNSSSPSRPPKIIDVGLGLKANKGCKFPGFLVTSKYCIYNSPPPGEICKWTYMLDDKSLLLPFQELSALPYNSMNLYFNKDSFYTTERWFEFRCQEKRENSFLLKVSRRLSKEAFNYMCIKFLEKGRNVAQIQVSPVSDTANQELCLDGTLKASEQLLIADINRQVPSCPEQLQGGFFITSIYDAVNNAHCISWTGDIAVFESDCSYKEGIHIDLSSFRNCRGFNKVGGRAMARILHEVMLLRCYSTTWVDGNYTYVLLKREETEMRYVHRDPDHPYVNHERFYCVKFRRSPDITGIELFLFLDSSCRHGVTESTLNGSFFRMSLVSLRDAEITGRFQVLLKQVYARFSPLLQGNWLAKSANGDTEINIKSNMISFSKPVSSYMCLQSYGGGLGTLPCTGNLWMSSEGQILNFSQNYVLVSSDMCNGCRARMVGLGVLEPEQGSHIAYRLTKGYPLPWELLFSRNLKESLAAEQKTFCESIYLFSPDPFPLRERNIEKVAFRKELIGRDLPYVSCRFAGPLPRWFFGKFPVQITRNIPDKSITCTGTIDTCDNPNVFRLHAGVPCAKLVNFGCVGVIWGTADDEVDGRHFLIQDLSSKEVYCAKHGTGFEIIRSTSMQCFEFHWGVIAHQGRFSEEIKLLYEDKYDVCPTQSVTTKSTHGYDKVEVFITHDEPATQYIPVEKARSSSVAQKAVILVIINFICVTTVCLI